MFYNFFVYGLVKGRVSVTLFGMGNFKVYVFSGVSGVSGVQREQIFSFYPVDIKYIL